MREWHRGCARVLPRSPKAHVRLTGVWTVVCLCNLSGVYPASRPMTAGAGSGTWEESSWDNGWMDIIMFLIFTWTDCMCDSCWFVMKLFLRLGLVSVWHKTHRRGFVCHSKRQHWMFSTQQSIVISQTGPATMGLSHGTQRRIRFSKRRGSFTVLSTGLTR